MKARIILGYLVLSYFLVSCAVNREYEEAIMRNTISAYEDYQRNFPNSKYKLDVQTRLVVLYEEEAWRVATRDHTIESYQNYLVNYSYGKHARDARDFIENLKYQQRLMEAWELTKEQNSIEAYQKFIDSYPSSFQIYEAKWNMSSLMESDAWRKASDSNSILSYSNYLEDYPNGAHEMEARVKLKDLEDEQIKPKWSAVVSENSYRAYLDFYNTYPSCSYAKIAWEKIIEFEDRDWELAKKKNTIRAYRDFIKKYPGNIHVEDAERRIIDLEVDQIFKGDHGSLPPMSKSTGSSYSSTNKVNIFNNTEYTLTIRYSGPESRKIVIPPRGRDNQTVLPSGNYRITASVDAAYVSNYAGTEYLSGGEYDSEYYIRTEIRH